MLGGLAVEQKQDETETKGEDPGYSGREEKRNALDKESGMPTHAHGGSHKHTEFSLVQLHSYRMNKKNQKALYIYVHI